MLGYIVFGTAVTLWITRGKISEKLRALYPELLGCAMCTGHWVGLGIAIPMTFFIPVPFEWVIGTYGGVSILSWVISLTTDALIQLRYSLSVWSEDLLKEDTSSSACSEAHRPDAE